ncbi:tetratricopeptide repeat protein [Xanthovirga aplysinae]|uniref:tetratricopeptide repeat protein n=1 Tax=Xanthovirga aplysinae TaxID=2529853 RepID=UPI0012BD37D4|nr:hypothetical protein [Xanthovirga aplysinae]MTI31353.1 hypothetical protein [Xanthovirga aplysinae]
MKAIKTMNNLVRISLLVVGLCFFSSLGAIGRPALNEEIAQKEMNDIYNLIKEHLSEDPTLALKFTEELTTLADKENNDLFLAKASNLRGYILKNQLEYKAAMRNFYEALSYIPDQDKYRTYIYSNIGWTYTLMERYEEAILFLTKAMKISIAHDNFIRESILGTMANTYIHSEQFEKALELLYDRINKSQTREDLMIAHGNLGYYFLVKNELDSASFHLEKSKEHSVGSKYFNQSYVQANLLSNMGHLALKRGELNMAQSYLEECYNLSDKLNIGITIEESLEGLTQIFLDKNDAHKYHEYSQKFLAFRDQKKEQLENYYIYELDRKEKELADQKEEQQAIVVENEKEKTNMILLVAILTTALVLSLTFGYFLIKQRSRIITNPYTGQKINLGPFLKYLNHHGYDINQISTILEKDAEFWLEYDPNGNIQGAEILKRLENFEKLSKAFKEISEPSS